MICLRCGYCCLMYDVVIVSDPDKPADDENNIEFKQNNQRCKHLVGDKIGEFSSQSVCPVNVFFKPTAAAISPE